MSDIGLRRSQNTDVRKAENAGAVPQAAAQMTDRREGVRTGEDTGNANPCRRSGTATFGLRRKPRRRHTLLIPACRAEKGEKARRLISGDRSRPVRGRQ
ncbi:hypothetical protein FG170_26195 (plasmid) [Serratia marcescens]|nr:hypothetical protein FG170_26195 [Serratia marcescens]